MNTYQLKPGFTKQQVLDTIRARVPKGGCLADSGICAYRNDEGGACAMGAFIPDDHRAANSKTRGNAAQVLRNYPDLEQYMPMDLDGMLALQGVHDICFRVDVVEGLNIVSKLEKFIEEQVVEAGA